MTNARPQMGTGAVVNVPGGHDHGTGPRGQNATVSRVGDRLFYLYDAGWDDSRLGWEVRSYPVTRVTGTRVYFTDGYSRRERFVARDHLEEIGEAEHRGTGQTLYAAPPALPGRRAAR